VAYAKSGESSEDLLEETGGVRGFTRGHMEGPTRWALRSVSYATGRHAQAVVTALRAPAGAFLLEEAGLVAEASSLRAQFGAASTGRPEPVADPVDGLDCMAMAPQPGAQSLHACVPGPHVLVPVVPDEP
jgi:hypothetical protein